MKYFLLLLFVVMPTFASGQDYVSHPGGRLDQFIHGYEYGQPPVAAADTASLALSRPAAASFGSYSYSVTSESYPTHSVRWHIIGSRESREELIQHLTTHPEHADVRRIYTANDLHRMTRAQLQTLHDDSHERRVVNVKRVTWGPAPGFSNPEQVVSIRAAPAYTGTAMPAYSIPMATYYDGVTVAPARVQGARLPVAAGGCPGRVCPTSAAQRKAARRQARAEARQSGSLASGVGAQIGLFNFSK